MQPQAAAPDDPLRGQVVVVTGGTAGIGLELAIELARRGAAVAVVSRSRARVEEAVAALGHGAGSVAPLGLALDVTRRDDMQRMAEAVLERHGRIDALVACAGVLRPASGRIALLRDTRAEDFDEVLAVNLKGTFLSNQAVLPAMMRQRRGQIVNVSSTSGLRGHAFDGAYCASKFAVLGLTEALAEEARPYGVRVQAALPGATESMIWDQNGPIPKPQHVLPTERLVRAILFLLALPLDTVVPRVAVAPQAPAELPAWLRRPAAVA